MGVMQSGEFTRNFGTVGNYVVFGGTRAAAMNEDHNLGYVYTLNLRNTSTSTTTELVSQPALMAGAVGLTSAGLATVAALHVALGV